jgi:DNA-binding NtrC family response regulator
MPWSTPASPKPRAANGFSTLVAASDALEAPLARTRIRAAILGNDTAYREALANMVNAMPDFQCLWQAAESERALTRLHASRPDVLLFDIGKPAQSDTRFLCRLRQRAPRVLVIIRRARIPESIYSGAWRQGFMDIFSEAPDRRRSWKRFERSSKAAPQCLPRLPVD